MSGEKEEKEEKELVIVEDQDLAKSTEDAAKETGDDEDEDDEGSEDGGDKRVAHAEGEEEGEDAEKATRRQAKQNRRERQRAARERSERELNYWRQRAGSLEKRFSTLERETRQTRILTIDQQLTAIKSQIENAKEIEAAAIKEGEGEDAVEAREIREALEAQAAALTNVKERAKNPPPEDSREVPPAAKLALGWIKKHKDWYNPAGGDEDSDIAKAVESNLLRNGGDPTDPDYWDELDRRLARRLPHLFKGKKAAREDDEDEGDDPPPRRESKRDSPRKAGGPRVSVGGQERTLKPGEVYISPERKAAMIEAGVWDDPKLRQKMLRQYRQWDEENRA